MTLKFVVVRQFWRLLPKSLRGTAFLQSMRKKLAALLAGYNDIYSPEFYRTVADPEAARAAPVIARFIREAFDPRRVIDVGCGTGTLLEALKESGCECLGLEYADAAITACRRRGLNARKFDITRPKQADSLGRFDVCVSLEVAEHLPANFAAVYLDLLCSLAPVLVFTAATPGQGGIDHVNEQPHEYWISRLKARGFALDIALSEAWRADWKQAGVVSWYYANIMVFRSQSGRS